MTGSGKAWKLYLLSASLAAAFLAACDSERDARAAINMADPATAIDYDSEQPASFAVFLMEGKQIAGPQAVNTIGECLATALKDSIRNRPKISTISCRDESGLEIAQFTCESFRRKEEKPYPAGVNCYRPGKTPKAYL